MQHAKVLSEWPHIPPVLGLCWSPPCHQGGESEHTPGESLPHCITAAPDRIPSLCDTGAGTLILGDSAHLAGLLWGCCWDFTQLQQKLFWIQLDAQCNKHSEQHHVWPASCQQGAKERIKHSPALGRRRHSSNPFSSNPAAVLRDLHLLSPSRVSITVLQLGLLHGKSC